MFQKANHKGMALMVHTLFCLFDDDKYRHQFSRCWFPYSTIEMREFRKVAEEVAADLVIKGKISEADMTKGAMETATGIKMWTSLRAVSDAVLYERIAKNSTIVGQGIPRISCLKIGDSAQAEANEAQKSTDLFKLAQKMNRPADILAIPPKGSIDPIVLNRSIRALEAHVAAKEANFNQKCVQIDE